MIAIIKIMIFLMIFSKKYWYFGGQILMIAIIKLMIAIIINENIIAYH